LLVFLPLAGAVMSLCSRTQHFARRIALVTALLETLLAIVVLALFQSDVGGFQMLEQHAWIPDLGIQYLLGVDGIAVLFLPVTAMLAVLAILASWHQVTHLCSFYYAMLLALVGITMGVFLALDTMLFFLFWELTLPPIYFLISLWGGGTQRRMAGMKYTMYMMFGGVALLFAFILLAQQAGAQSGELVFSLPQLQQTPVAVGSQSLIFALLVLGFAVKAPLFPFHTWLPTVAMESPAQITALLVGLKLGAFGLLRFALPLAPAAAAEYSWLLGLLGAVTLIYAAFIALHQSNLRRMLAYASISHVGLVVIGIAALNLQGIQGAVFQLLNFTMIASGLMFLGGFLQQRTGTTELISLGSLAGDMPRLTALFFILGLASIGLPGTSGFAAELLLILGAFKLHFSVGLVVLVSIVIGAAYLLYHARGIFWGPGIQTERAPYADLKQEELLILLPACVFVLVLGLFPNLVLNTIAGAAEDWLALFP
jgi:NADH-quinone oxidoreductase subunit M